MVSHQLPKILMSGLFVLASGRMFGLPSAAVAGEMREHYSETASFQVSLHGASPLKLRVVATIPIEGDSLHMWDSYPAELPEMESKGWSALISDLSITDTAGEAIEALPVYPNRWTLSRNVRGRIRCSYEVDYSIFASQNWSSPLESAFADSNWTMIVGSSVFITTPAVADATVEFRIPSGLEPIVPWTKEGSSRHRYKVTSTESLLNNMLVFAGTPADTFTVSGFRLQLVTTGHWQSIRAVVESALRRIVTREVEIMRFSGSEIYSVILLPLSDHGGNAFHQSFTYVYSDPDSTNCAQWSNTLAHEIFHYWNYGKLRGESYARSQWFQEGFTEYVANLVLANTGISDSTAFLNKLSEHVANYRKLTTTLENPGTHKGKPLYSAGALVAFMWDVMIRNDSHEKSDIGEFFHNLVVQTKGGQIPYSWTHLRAALQATAGGDWEGFYQAHIRGAGPFPIERILQLAGLKLIKSPDGEERIIFDPDASAQSRSLFQSLISG